MTTQTSADGRAVASGKLFNEFLSRAVRNGGVAAEHRRIRSRQPENEVFVRKALVTMARLVPDVSVNPSFTELSAGQARHGRAALADAAAQRMRADGSLARYAGEPSREPTTVRAAPTLELFTLLHAYAHVAAAPVAAPIFGAGAATVGASMSGQSDMLKPALRDAADSVFAQSFADTHALSLIAAFDGNAAALSVLTEVMRRREAAGDFGAFSRAPLSQDSSTALELLRHEFSRGTDFAAMGRDELLGHSLWVAAEGLGTWLQKHGTSARAAAGVSQAVEVAGQILAAASGGLGSQAKVGHRLN